MTVNFPKATILGYPRIGVNRELKKIEEAYWGGKIELPELREKTKELRLKTYNRLVELGLNKDDWSIPMSFSYYDQVLDASLTFGIIPKRFEYLRSEAITSFSSGNANTGVRVAGSFGEKFRRPLGVDELNLNAYFTIARGDKTKGEEGLPGEMTKWFNTNYHYIVPEFHKDTQISLANYEIVRQFEEASAAGFNVRPVIVGPATLLALGKYENGLSPRDFDVDLHSAYARLISMLASKGAKWIQFDEPAFISENIDFPNSEIIDIAGKCYHELAKLNPEDGERPYMFVTSPYDGIDDLFPLYEKLEVDALHLDLVNGKFPETVSDNLNSKTLVAGLIDGHNVWRADLDEVQKTINNIKNIVGEKDVQISISTNTSLQHVPHNLSPENEPWLNQNRPELVSNLSFADEKIQEVVAISENKKPEGRSEKLPLNRVNADVQNALANVKPEDFQREPISQRKVEQSRKLNLPLLPTTTIGSFPQTVEIRKARASFKKGEIDVNTYKEAMKQEIKSCVELQESIGIDVLVHGEAERNDMVQYFAENFDGCDVTENGWVQSYGSRCTKPSLIWGDVSRPQPFTVEWSQYAQSLTQKPMKGMLTGPVTILAWSFVRNDQSFADTANQVALALRDEIKDLETAGISVIQVDEPALRELLPLKISQHQNYLDWSVNSFKLATSSVRPDTQIHTHLCYSEFEVVINAIIGLNADVTSIEAARSKMEIVKGIVNAKYPLAIGPGVYDIHSPRIPDELEIASLLQFAVDEFIKGEIPLSDLWVNPDCGLKTRKNEESTPSLENMVKATLRVREQLNNN